MQKTSGTPRQKRAPLYLGYTHRGRQLSPYTERWNNTSCNCTAFAVRTSLNALRRAALHFQQEEHMHVQSNLKALYLQYIVNHTWQPVRLFRVCISRCVLPDSTQRANQNPSCTQGRRDVGFRARPSARCLLLLGRFIVAFSTWFRPRPKESAKTERISTLLKLLTRKMMKTYHCTRMNASNDRQSRLATLNVTVAMLHRAQYIVLATECMTHCNSTRQ